MDGQEEGKGPSKKAGTYGGIWDRLLRLKPIEKSVRQSASNSRLGWMQLLAYGIAATVGSGIYAVVGDVAKELTGPAVILSIGGAGLLALLTAFCYLELATVIPASGSSYVYGYSILGELVGFLLGWTSTLEYAFAASVIAISMIDYLVMMVAAAEAVVPTWLYAFPEDRTAFFLTLNVLAATLVLAVTLVVLRGVAFGARINAGLTVLNVALLTLIISVGAACVTPANWTPFLPHGAANVFHGMAQMMFCYIGFDTICNLTGEAKHPRHLRVAVLGTVGCASVLYAAVGIVLTGMLPYGDIVSGTSLASAFEQVGQAGVAWTAHVVRVCALLMMFATLLACLIGQPKLFHIMAKDGFLPRLFCRENAQGQPIASMLLSGVLAALVALCIRKVDIVDLTALGALVTFSINAAALLVLRLRALSPAAIRLGYPCLGLLMGGSLLAFFLFHNDMLTAFWVVLVVATLLPAVALLAVLWHFRHAGPSASPLSSSSSACSSSLPSSPTPASPLSLNFVMCIVPVLSIIGNAAVIPTLSWVIFVQYLVWVLLGLLVYCFYGYSHSALELELRSSCEATHSPASSSLLDPDSLLLSSSSMSVSLETDPIKGSVAAAPKDTFV